MADQTHAAHQLTEVLTYVGARDEVAPQVAKSLLSLATKLLKSVDGQTRNDLELARDTFKESI